MTSARGSGCSLPLYNFDGETALYCANSIVRNSSGVACAHGDPFPLNDANVITNRGLLANASCALDTVSPTAVNTPPISTSSSNNTSCAPTATHGNKENNKELVIGVAVGVPLGVLFITAVAWALFERRKRFSLKRSVSQGFTQNYPTVQQPYRVMDMGPSELDQNPIRPYELDGSRPKD